MTDAWRLDESEFPCGAPIAVRIRFALRYAILAPSSHNSQPWRFKISRDTVTVIADRTRSLPVVDPYDRELTISCGAALLNLRAALAHFGMDFSIDLFPAQAEPDVVATVRVSEGGAMDPHLARLCPAIPRRVTNRGPFNPIAVPESVCAGLIGAARAEGVALSLVGDLSRREQVADLVARADRLQFGDVRFRRELASWIHPGRAGDGMPAHALGIPRLLDFETQIARMVIRTFDLGDGAAASDAQLANGAPLLLCFSTEQDDAPAWLFAGQALERVLLQARLEGYDVSYLNQPIEVAELRQELGNLLDTERFPQLLLRMGRGTAAAHTPRRTLDEVAG